MKEFTWKTQLYILSTILVGFALLLVALPDFSLPSTPMVILLTILASLALIYKVDGPTAHTHINISFLIYGCSLVLFGPAETMLIILVSHLVEWFVHRYPWYIQVFNLTSYLWVAYLTGVFITGFNPDQSLARWESAAAILVAMAIFTLLNHLAIGLIVWLARGESIFKSGVFSFLPLMIDWILLCMGATVAVLWLINPLMPILAILPIYLIYTTLRVPALERQTETDPKTGLFNHRFFEKALENEMGRSSRFGRPLTVVMADLDLLRNINNTYGHLAGDEVLIGIAKILKEQTRDYDIVARFGGEEFAILMPETTPESAFPRVEEIRRQIEGHAFEISTNVTPIRASMSFGIATLDEGTHDSKGVVHNADLALYHSKLNGRNQTTIYSKDGFQFFLLQKEAEKPAQAEVASATPATIQELPQKNHVPEADLPHEETQVGARPVQKIFRHYSKNAVNLYIGLLVAVASGMFLATLHPFLSEDWAGMLAFALLAILTEWLSIDIYTQDTSISTSAIAVLGGTLLFGPLGALVTSVSVGTTAFFRHKSPISRILFNISNQLIAGLACLFLIYLTGTPFNQWPIALQGIYSVPAAGLMFLITSFSISVGIHLSVNMPIRSVWEEKFRWLLPYYLSMGVVAYVLIHSYLSMGLSGVVVTIVPLLLLRISQKQYIDRTRSAVSELNRKNAALQEKAEEISRLSEGLLKTLAEVIDLRSPYVLGHSKHVTRYAVMIAQKMGLSAKRIETIRKASLMHDVGKLGIPDPILSKPNKLDADEYDIIKRHPGMGAEILRRSEALQYLVPHILHHHERYDGQGYPDGLMGEQIPLEARIISVADAVDAMASDRPYRRALGFEAIMAELQQHSGRQFDPLVVKAFTEIVHREGKEIFSCANCGKEIAEEGFQTQPIPAAAAV